MSRTAKIAVVVLAAGFSRRFGTRDKLLALYNGKPLAMHIATELQSFPYSFAVVVARNPIVANLFTVKNFHWVRPDRAGAQSDSLRAGLRYAHTKGASHVLLLLADMPEVSRQHLHALLQRIGPHPVISQYKHMTLPPAVIPRSLFPRLMHLRGDRGAALILRKCSNLRRCSMDARSSMDVDHPDDIPQ